MTSGGQTELADDCECFFSYKAVYFNLEYLCPTLRSYGCIVFVVRSRRNGVLTVCRSGTMESLPVTYSSLIQGQD